MLLHETEHYLKFNKMQGLDGHTLAKVFSPCLYHELEFLGSDTCVWHEIVQLAALGPKATG